MDEKINRYCPSFFFGGGGCGGWVKNEIRHDVQHEATFEVKYTFKIQVQVYTVLTLTILARNLPESSKILQFTFGNMP